MKGLEAARLLKLRQDIRKDWWRPFHLMFFLSGHCEPGVVPLNEGIIISPDSLLGAWLSLKTYLNLLRP